MPTWPELTIEQCCTRVTSGGTPRRNNLDFYRGGTIPWVKTGELKDRIIDPSDIGEWITEEASKNSSAKVLPRNTVLLAMYGDGQTIGTVGLVRSPMSCNQACCAMIPNPDICDARFLFYAIRYYRNSWIKIAHGGAQRNLSGTIIRERKIAVPPIPIQERIASILATYDDLIEVNRRRIALLEEMARRLYEEWFVRFRFPGHEGHAIVETPEGPLPNGWRREELGALCVEIRDAVSPADLNSDTPYVGLEHIPRRSTTLDTWGRVDEVTSTKLRFLAGDVLFGKIRPYFHKVVLSSFDGVCSSDAIVIRSRAPEWTGLVLSVTSSDRFVAQAVATSNGTKMPRANWGVLVRTSVPIAPDGLMRTFNKATVEWAELAASLNNANTQLAASRDLLLPRLISGYLSAPSAELELEAVA